MIENYITVPKRRRFILTPMNFQRGIYFIENNTSGNRTTSSETSLKIDHGGNIAKDYLDYYPKLALISSRGYSNNTKHSLIGPICFKFIGQLNIILTHP